MNKNKLKVYAPQAREEFIKIVTERAAYFGITAKKIEPCQIKGDYAFISGKPFPKSTEKSREELVKRIESKGFSQVIEEAAYTWFNRFAAIRFMELNGYLSHGYRVLSHPQGQSEPEILEKAHYLERLDGLEKEEIIALKTAGNKDAELYRKLIIAQCNELHSAMPFLFERVDDPTELLLPDNLLNTDSVIRQMVDEIPEDDWKEVEIIGWLYQFYISEKKDALMKAKKAYKTEDIPAVTQLFTPNWIVKYLVQNSLGAKWLATYPASKLKDKMEYYIEPAEQTDEVKQQLKRITPDSLNPEELTVMDPACGSGHILVEAYNLLKDIYLEQGFRPKDIPALILTKNLYGLEIDDRAAQLAGFALMMKARQDDRQIFEKAIKPNILVLKSANSRVQGGKESADIVLLIELFENASTFGSLIRVPEELILKLPSIRQELEHKKGDLSSHDVFTGSQYYEDLLELVKQAEILSKRYDCVIANPPYMGGKGMNATLKEFAKIQYPVTKSDLFTMFIERSMKFVVEKGMAGFVMPYVWMFLSTYEEFRNRLENSVHIKTLIQLEYNAFEPACVPVCVFTFCNTSARAYKGTYIKLSDFKGYENQAPKTLEAIHDENCSWRFTASFEDFNKIPGRPIAYWSSDSILNAFISGSPLISFADVQPGLQTSNNERFVRYWFEVSNENIGFGYINSEVAASSNKTWFPYNKGGDYRLWYGNNDCVVNWKDNGREIKNYVSDKYPYLNGNIDYVVKDRGKYFLPSITWSKISTVYFGIRQSPPGFLFDVAGSSAFPKEGWLNVLTGFLASKVGTYIMDILNPTMNKQTGNVADLPILDKIIPKYTEQIEKLVRKAICISKNDWDDFEESWDFQGHPLLQKKNSSLRNVFSDWKDDTDNRFEELKQIEAANNQYWIRIYALEDILKSDVDDRLITIRKAAVERDCKSLVFYSIGCMMGRYSLDKPGLVYANSGNEGFDLAQYKTFPADEDGIIPITNNEWFDDDAACRFFRFIETAWDKKGLDNNLEFISEAIGRKPGESSREAIRRYFVNDFYKDHCKTYKKRPIYWLFTSGKEKAFQALVYLHRYNEGTLARMRTEYVLPLQTKINRYIEHIEKDKDAAASTSAANKIQKEITTLLKQKDELIKFDEHLRHYADIKIKLDLDDGVKVNYTKFGDLLAKI